MGNYNLFNNIVKEIPTNLRRFIVRKLRRFNMIPRAEKIIEKTATEKGKRAPLPERIQQQIDEVLKNEPDLLKEVSAERNETLLERLKKVFVSSTGVNKDMFDKSRLTPTEYNLFKPDVIKEYKENIPEGKFSLQQAEIFLREFQRNDDLSTVELLSEKLKIEPKILMCMLTHTKVFKSALPINTKSEKQTLLQRTTELMLPSIIETEADEEKMYRIFDRRQVKFKQFYEEKLGLKNDEYNYYHKNPGIRKVLVSLNLVKDNQVSTTDTKLGTSVATRDDTVPPDGKTHIIVKDLKPGEDPDALEEIPDFPLSESYLRNYRDRGNSTGELSRKIFYPHDEKFDVFKVMEEQDREARNQERRLRRMKKKETEQNPEGKPKEEQPKDVIQAKISSESS